MKVAVAGASTGVGRHIAESILARGKHTLIILSRLDIPHFSERGAIVHSVSYDSPDSLLIALAGVHTVISAIGDHSQSSVAQVALVHAAVAAGVTRFVPSGWACTDGGADDIIELYRYKQPTLEALRHSNLLWSHPETGIFMNYFATPKQGVGHLKPLKFWIDIENCKASIPGDGNKKLVYTAAEDVGEFIAKCLEFESEWPQALRMVGSSISHNELVKIAEKVRGKPFEIVYQNEEVLKNALIPNPPSSYVNLTTQFSLAILQGRFTFEPTFDNVVPMSFQQPAEFLEKWWGKA